MTATISAASPVRRAANHADDMQASRHRLTMPRTGSWSGAGEGSPASIARCMAADSIWVRRCGGAAKARGAVASMRRFASWHHCGERRRNDRRAKVERSSPLPRRASSRPVASCRGPSRHLRVSFVLVVSTTILHGSRKSHWFCRSVARGRAPNREVPSCCLPQIARLCRPAVSPSPQQHGIAETCLRSRGV